MNKKIICLIVFLTFLIFSPSLFNGFAGDDDIVITRNTFYDSWENVPRLFSKDYLTSSGDLDRYDGDILSSGSVAYRPVVSFSFFIDHAIWGKRAFGYHLTNLLLHVISTVLVLILIWVISRNKFITLWTGMLFGLHPVQVETVCSIGYRSDLIATVLTLLSFLTFVQSRQSKSKGRFYFLLSAVFLFLGLFSKEIVIALPILFVLYDLLFASEKKDRGFIRKRTGQYSVYFLISFFYLYVYFVLFPNTVMAKALADFSNPFLQIFSAMWIFALYLKDLFIPIIVKMLPPLYKPSIMHFFGVKIFVAAIVCGFFVFVIFYFCNRQKKISFGLLWYLAFLLPTLNVVSNPSPMAHRFLYLPSIGIFSVFAAGIHHLVMKLEQSEKFANSRVLAGIILFCVLSFATYPLIYCWNSDYTVGKYLTEYYPQNPKAQLILGIEYSKRNQWQKAKEPLLLAQELGAKDPRLSFLLALSYGDKPSVSEKFLLESIRLYPTFAPAYIALARLYLFSGKYDAAAVYAQKGIALWPSAYSGYGYLIQAQIFSGYKKEAIKTFQEAAKKIPDAKLLQTLKTFLDFDRKKDRPVDLSI